MLHIDRQDFYGGESASLNLTQLFKKFRDSPPDKSLGRDRDWCVDLIPKFLMANGELTNMLVHTDVTRYVEFKQIAASYVYRSGRIAKVPSTEYEAVRSLLMGIFEKRRMRSFMEFIANYKEEEVSTHKGLDLDANTMSEVYYKFGLESGTRDFIGHAMALYSDDEYLEKPARETYNRILLYVQSVARYGKSPYIYPLYGLGELPQGFARLSAIYGGTYMLDTPIEEVLYDDNGVFCGVKTKEGTAKAPIVIGDPTYFPEKVKKTGKKVIRAICILKHPIAAASDCDSLQIIIPQNQVNRKNDIYIAVVSHSHNVCTLPYYLAIASTVVETDNPHVELKPAFDLIGEVEDQFISVTDLLEPIEDGKKDHVFILKSYDASSHFESTTDDVKDIYERVTGYPLILKKREAEDDEKLNAS